MIRRSTSILSLLVLLIAPWIQLRAQEPCDALSVEVIWGCHPDGGSWAAVQSVSGQVYPITIEWSTGADVQYVTGLADGAYWVMVTDATGCWVKEDFTTFCTVDPDCMLDATISYGCVEGMGWASVDNITGASGTTTILWSTGETSDSVSDLMSGDYWVAVLDEEGCWEKEYFTIACSPMDCDLTMMVETGCQDDETGWASLENITTSAWPITIVWSTGADVQYLPDLPNGMHWVMVTDAAGCWLKEEFEIDCEKDCQLRTQTMGGWGSPANGNNPGMYRDMHFASAFPTGLTIGCTNTLSLTSAAAVQAFLPSGGQPTMLPSGSMIDPANYNNTLAGQLVALSLSVGFDAADADFGESDGLLMNATINSGMFAGWTVQQLLDEANNFIGGCGSNYTASQLNGALTMVNENFVDGDTNNGHIDCAPGEKRMLDTSGDIAIRAYPVPVTDVLTVQVSSTVDAAVGLILRDATGRVISEVAVGGITAGVGRSVNVNVSDVPTGIYLLTVVQDGRTVGTERISIAR